VQRLKRKICHVCMWFHFMIMEASNDNKYIVLTIGQLFTWNDSICQSKYMHLDTPSGDA
jgi:hypothetical protein